MARKWKFKFDRLFDKSEKKEIIYLFHLTLIDFIVLLGFILLLIILTTYFFNQMEICKSNFKKLETKSIECRMDIAEKTKLSKEPLLKLNGDFKWC